MKVVIIGGVAGGATAAARLRRLDETAEITIFEKSGFISYANCGLPYYIGGTIEDKDELTLQTPESFYSRFHVNIKVLHEVTAINPDIKTVTVKNLCDGKIFDEKYDKLIISTGAKPVKPKFSGIDQNNIFTLRTVEDTLTIKNYIETHNPRSAVIAGGGFIGIEAAENLKQSGLDVTIIQGDPHLMLPFDSDMAAFIHSEVRRNGIELMLDSMVEEFEEQNGKTLVKIQGGNSVTADMVILAIGVVPDASLAGDAGLKQGIRGSICVNDRMQTSDPDIYAVGDAVQIKNIVTSKDTLISLAGPANK